jgi:hypothetical protein
MSNSNSDIKKLVKYQSKLAGCKGDHMKQQLYNQKMAEYETKIKNKGIDISKILRGGADEEDPDLAALRKSFEDIKKKAVLPEGKEEALKKVTAIKKYASDAKLEHDKLIQKFVEEIKKLHSEKDLVVDRLKQEHDSRISALL